MNVKAPSTNCLQRWMVLEVIQVSSSLLLQIVLISWIVLYCAPEDLIARYF